MNKRNCSANSGKNSGRIANLRPWKKGQSGNPDGRPKKTLITDALRMRLAEVDPEDPLGRTHAQVIADGMIARAKQKNRGQQDAAEIADRTEGRPKQEVNLGGEVEVENINHLNREQLFEKLTTLLNNAAKRRIPGQELPIVLEGQVPPESQVHPRGFKILGVDL